MAEISKLSGVAIADVAKVDAVTKANIANINDLTVPGGFTQGILDTYTGAAAAYSVRRLNSAYTGACMRVRRDSDNTEQDIGFDSNGDLDTAAIATFVGSGNNGYVRKWYGQEASGGTGSGTDADQATASQQPQIYNGTAVITENGKPALDFDKASLQYFDFSTNAFAAKFPELFVALNVVVKDFNATMIMGTTTSTARYWQLADVNGYFVQGGSKFGSTNIYGAGQTLFNMHATSTTTHARVDGTQSNGGSPSAIGSGTLTYRLGAWPGVGQYYLDGTMQEFIIYPDNQGSTDRTGIETNINTYFSIY